MGSDRKNLYRPLNPALRGVELVQIQRQQPAQVKRTGTLRVLLEDLLDGGLGRGHIAGLTRCLSLAIQGLNVVR
jgi:hypothetical protein